MKISPSLRPIDSRRCQPKFARLYPVELPIVHRQYISTRVNDIAWDTGSSRDVARYRFFEVDDLYPMD